MSNLVAIPIAAALVYTLVKYVEEVYVEKRDVVALKTLVRDGLLVFLACLASTFVFVGFESHLKQIMNMITETKVSHPDGEAPIFDGDPGF